MSGLQSVSCVEKGSLLGACALAAVIFAAPQAAFGTAFTDDFTRPNGPVCEGWCDSYGNTGGTMVIRNYRLSTSTADCNVGIFRRIAYIGTVTAGAHITEENGYGGLLRRYTTQFLFHNDGTLTGGYGVGFYRGDQNYNNSAVVRTYNGATIDSETAPFQFGKVMTVTVSVGLDGKVTGHLKSGTNKWDFSFPAHDLSGLPGQFFAIGQGCPDSRSSTITYPTIDNVTIQY